MVPIAYMPSPIPRQVGWNLFARTIPFASAFPRTLGGSAPASLFSGPAQRSLTLQPARSPSRLSDPLHQRLQQSRCLHRCSDCYRVERTSSRAGMYTPAVDQRLHGAPGFPVIQDLAEELGYLILPLRPNWQAGAYPKPRPLSRNPRAKLHRCGQTGACRRVGDLRKASKERDDGAKGGHPY